MNKRVIVNKFAEKIKKVKVSRGKNTTALVNEVYTGLAE